MKFYCEKPWWLQFKYFVPFFPPPPKKKSGWVYVCVTHCNCHFNDNKYDEDNDNNDDNNVYYAMRENTILTAGHICGHKSEGNGKQQK